jgi:hypothetical protein
MKISVSILSVLSFYLLCTSCYYRKGDDLVIICDTTNTISYNLKVLPILQDNCYSCHTNITTGGGWLMGDYNKDKFMSQNANLVKAINHTIGYPQMPKNAAKLSDCNIAIITKWIKEGCLNN